MYREDNLKEKPSDKYPDGIIELDSLLGKDVGFTSDLFYKSWLWKTGNIISISFILTKLEGKGHFKSLIRKLLDLNFEVEIPTPLGKMEGFVTKYQLPMKLVSDEKMGLEYEVFTIKPSMKTLFHTPQERNLRYKENNQKMFKAESKGRQLPKKSSCEKCGTKGYLVRHHPDYNKPLEFQTLCQSCHSKTMRKDGTAF